MVVEIIRRFLQPPTLAQSGTVSSTVSRALRCQDRLCVEVPVVPAVGGGVLSAGQWQWGWPAWRSSVYRGHAVLGGRGGCGSCVGTVLIRVLPSAWKPETCPVGPPFPCSWRVLRTIPSSSVAVGEWMLMLGFDSRVKRLGAQLPGRDRTVSDEVENHAEMYLETCREWPH